MDRFIEKLLKYCFCYYKCSKNIDSQSIITWQDTKPFIPPLTCGVVIKVYDGDTITVASKLPYYKSELYRFSVRLKGIDTPEIKSNNEIEKIAAKKARDYLTNKILNKNVMLKNLSTEKYGRILADVYIEGIHINKLMIEEGFALEYNGGTKHSF